MPAEIYFSPKDGASFVGISEAQRRFNEAGLQCTIESDPDAADMNWFVFEPRSTTTICATVKDGKIVFATVHAAYDDKPEFAATLDVVLDGMGFSAGD